MTIELDEQIHLIADAAFAQTEPIAIPVPKRASQRNWMLVAAGVLIVTMVGALLVVGDRSEPSVPVDSIAPESLDFSTGMSAQAALAEIPFFELGSGAVSTVKATDLARIGELTGVAVAGITDPPDASTWIMILGALDRDATPIVAVPLSEIYSVIFREPEQFEAEIGFAGADIDAFVSWQFLSGLRQTEPEFGPSSFDVLRLRSDMSVLTSQASADDIIDVGSGEDFVSNFDGTTTPLRPVGQPLRIGVDETRSVVAISQSTPAVESWLANGRTLADQADARDLATALDRGGDLYATEMTFGDFEVRSTLFDPGPNVAFGIDDILITEPFTAHGIGWSGIGETQRTTIVYIFETADAAEASVQPIESLYRPEAPFVEQASVESERQMGSVFVLDDVTAAGRTVTVTGTAAPGVGPIRHHLGTRRAKPPATASLSWPATSQPAHRPIRVRAIWQQGIAVERSPGPKPSSCRRRSGLW